MTLSSPFEELFLVDASWVVAKILSFHSPFGSNGLPLTQRH